MCKVMKLFFTVIILCVNLTALAGHIPNKKKSDTVDPTHKIHFPTIYIDSVKHYKTYAHWRPIGACLWIYKSGPGIPLPAVTLEVSEYEPDLLVTSYNREKDDPWFYANYVIDRISHKTASVGAKLFGFTSSEGIDNGSVASGNSVDTRDFSAISKYTDVIGAPNFVRYLPLQIKQITTSFRPYYLSMMDLQGRLGIDSAVRFINSANFKKFYIGQSFRHKWGYEFPRSMVVSSMNGYEASIIAALHAIDITTNKHKLHTMMFSSSKVKIDSCGKNCAISNVTEDNDKDHNERWEEIYPFDKHIQIGENPSKDKAYQKKKSHHGVKDFYGKDDNDEGNGNYVFLVWRHYRGCIQHSGHLVKKTIDVDETKLR